MMKITMASVHSFFSKITRSISPFASYERLISVNISKERLLHNLSLFEKSYPDTPICPVLKANAYGHGLKEIAGILAEQPSIPFFIVDSYYEALFIRKNVSRSQEVLIIGFTPERTLGKARQKHFIFTLSNIEQIREVARSSETWGRSKRFHLKIDTGMHRQGIHEDEVAEAIRLFKTSPNLKLEGVCSHLAEADNKDHAFTEKQIERWNKIVAVFEKEFPARKLHFHLTNTAGADHIRKARATVTRLGIGLYGIVAPTHALYEKVKPVLEMRTIVTAVKKVKHGGPIGYDRTFTAPKDMSVAIIPVGYFEGIDRRLSNKGCVTIAGKDRQSHECPIVGRVSMDIVTVDVSAVADQVHIGSSVIVINSDRKAKNSIESMAALCETIPYELLVHIPEGLHREIV